MAGKQMPIGKCWCGCGGDTKPGRFFIITHDRKAESRVLTQEYGSIADFLEAHGYQPGGKKDPSASTTSGIANPKGQTN